LFSSGYREISLGDGSSFLSTGADDGCRIMVAQAKEAGVRGKFLASCPLQAYNGTRTWELLERLRVKINLQTIEPDLGNASGGNIE